MVVFNKLLLSFKNIGLLMFIFIIYSCKNNEDKINTNISKNEAQKSSIKIVSVKIDTVLSSDSLIPNEKRINIAGMSVEFETKSMCPIKK